MEFLQIVPSDCKINFDLQVVFVIRCNTVIRNVPPVWVQRAHHSVVIRAAEEKDIADDAYIQRSDPINRAFFRRSPMWGDEPDGRLESTTLNKGLLAKELSYKCA